MTTIGERTRYVTQISVKDATHDTLFLSDVDPATVTGPNNYTTPGQQDQVVVAKPHDHTTGQAITVTYAVE